MVTKAEGISPTKELVTFSLQKSLLADSVHLMGDFNGWNPDSHPLTRENGDGTWQLTVELERGKSYQFRYLIKSGNAEVETIIEQLQV